MTNIKMISMGLNFWTRSYKGWKIVFFGFLNNIVHGIQPIKRLFFKSSGNSDKSFVTRNIFQTGLLAD